jgi:hypothetical protein
MFVIWLLVASAGVSAQEPAAPNVDVREVSVVTGRIDRIDPFGRSVTLRTAEGPTQILFVGPQLKIFNELGAGDDITVRITEWVTVTPRPNAKTTVVEDLTVAAGKSARAADVDVIQQLKVTVTIDSVDIATQMITYQGRDRRSVTRMVANRRLLDGLKRGDIVEITYSRERAIELPKDR